MLIAILATSVIAGSSYDSATTLPLEVTGGRAFVAVTVRNISTKFLLDSGAGTNLIDMAYARRLGIPLGEEGNTSGVGTSVSKYASTDPIVFSLNGTELQFVSSVAVDLAPLTSYNDEPILGILGFPLFLSNVVELDLDSRRLRIYPAGTFSPPKDAFGVKDVLSDGRIIVRIDIGLPNGSSRSARAQIDTGALGTLLLATPYGTKSGIAGIKPSYRIARLANGVGGGSPGLVCRVPVIRIGKWSFADPTIRVSTSSTGMLSTDADRSALMGYELLRRFKITFDLPHNRLFLEPSRAYRDVFPFDCCGIVLKREGREFVVEEVVTGSAASKAGVRALDVLISADGRRLDTMKYSEVVDCIRTPARPMTLNILRNRQRITLHIDRFDPLKVRTQVGISKPRVPRT